MICQNCGGQGCGYCRKDSEDALRRALYPRPGDLPAAGPSRWGNVQLLSTRVPATKPSTGPKYAFVATGPMPGDVGAISRSANITAMAYELRFSLDGVNFAPSVPTAAVGAQLQVDLIKMIDVKSQEMRETYILNPGQSQQSCTFLALAVQIVITLLGEAQDLWVQCVAAPVQTLDCGDARGDGGVILAGWDNSLSTTFQASGFVFPGIDLLLGANKARRQFIIQNASDTDLMFIFGGQPINWTGGSEQGTIILPGGQPDAVYESPVGCFRGNVFGSMKPGGDPPVGFILVTEGT